jgi:hypothetical protein
MKLQNQVLLYKFFTVKYDEEKKTINLPCQKKQSQGK